MRALLKPFLKQTRSLRRCEKGIAYLEFALATPFLLALLLGAIEVTRYIIVAQKVEKAAVTVSDLVAQSQTITTAQIDIIVQAAEQVVLPYEFSAKGYVIISSVTKTGSNPPKINWQYKGGGSWTKTSLIGVSGGYATLPTDFTLNDKDTIIVSEVFYNFSPLLVHSVVNSAQLYKLAIFKPRLGDLNTLN